MITRIASVLVALGGSTSVASAQAQSNPPVTVTYHLSWIEVSATAPYAPVGSPNGVLEPGEGARFAFFATLDPAPGTPITYPTSLLAGCAGAGIVGGFGFGDLDLSGNAGTGSWVVNQNTTPSANPNRLGVLPPFASAYPTGSGAPNAQGSAIMGITPAQGPWGDITAMNTSSPTPAMWRGLWVPVSYTPRTGSFQLELGGLGRPSMVYAIDNAVTLPVPVGAYSSYTAVMVPIVPAPGAAAMLAVSGLFTFRRASAARKRSLA